jgi:hypothetical protein
MKIELSEETVKEAILAYLQRTGLRATTETRVSVVPASKKPFVIAVTNLETVPAYIAAVEPQAPRLVEAPCPAAPPRPVHRRGEDVVRWPVRVARGGAPLAGRERQDLHA